MFPIKPLGHYAFENIPTIYDEDAVTALELCARTATKVNEVVKGVNEHVQDCEKVHDETLRIAKTKIGEAANNLLHEMAEAGELEGVLQSQHFATPQMYGAYGDGRHDDTEAVTRAIAENGRVFFPAGTYKIAGELRPGSCELIGAPGSKIETTGRIVYDGVYYPKMTRMTIEVIGGDYLEVIYIKDSYYGTFDGVTILQGGGSANWAIHLEGDGSDNGVYYQRFRNCVIDNFNMGIFFNGIANAHTVESCVFYRCAMPVCIDGGENINVIGNTFQSFTLAGVTFARSHRGNPISSLIMGNYFEANAADPYGTYCGDIDFSNCEQATGNFIIGNHYTYTKTNTHVVNMVSPNTVMDYYTQQESNAPNTLMGFTALQVLDNAYLNYGGDRFLGTIAPIYTNEDKVDLYMYTKTSSGNGWVRILTTGLNENDSVTLPPVWCLSINQGYKGYFKLGNDYDGTTVGAMTYDSNQKLIKRYDESGAWEYYQKVEGGPTTSRPTWKPRGYMFYDSTLGKPIWSTGSNTWVDATGTTV